MAQNVENDDLEVKTDFKKKPTKKTKEMLEDNAKQIEELKVLQTELDHEIASLDKDEQELGERSALKLKVTHKKFGEGQVVKQDGKYIEVKFADVVKKFVLPGCFADKFLELSDEDGCPEEIRRDLQP